MLFVDEPYISDFLRQTALENHLPVVNTASAQKLGLLPGTNLISEAEAVALARQTGDLRILTTSENSIGWIAQNLAFTEYPQKIELFKNKAKFRELTRSLTPGFFFKEVPLHELDSIRAEELPYPLILKPTIGFFSMGVHRIDDAQGWSETLNTLRSEIDAIRGIYPNEVLNVGSFLLEQIIEGDEFAIDAYFDAAGAPVVLDILHHPFSSNADVSDRVYTTSKEIITTNLDEFTAFLAAIGRVTGVHNFPMHVELRRNHAGALIPIEVNPMRFGGWCSTPDLGFAAYGINPYLYFFEQKRPDWEQLLKEKAGKLFSVVVLENSSGKRGDEIAAFDYDRVLAGFEKPLELRKIDFRTYPVFGFVFVETRAENRQELNSILRSDLNEFIRLK